MKFQFVIWCLVLGAFVAPLIALAWSVGDPLVSCGRTDPDATEAEQAPCTLCHIFVLGQNILGFLMWTAAPVLAVLAFTWGGFKVLISGPNPGLRQDGWRIIKNTVWGLLIVFGAWIVINELLIFFTGAANIANVPKSLTGWGPWNQIQCPL